MQQRLKTKIGAAWTWIIPSEFLGQFLVAVNDSFAAFDACFGWESFSSFAGCFKTSGFVIWSAW